jgi:hypothetical protein
MIFLCKWILANSARESFFCTSRTETQDSLAHFSRGDPLAFYPELLCLTSQVSYFRSTVLYMWCRHDVLDNMEHNGYQVITRNFGEDFYCIALQCLQALSVGQGKRR